MPYAPAHKENTRRRIVEAAAESFRREGIAEAGLAAIMRSAGLTHGGFYAHFDSKDELIRATIDHAQQLGLARWKRIAAEQGGLEGIVRWYLSAEHRDEIGAGCLLSCVAADLPRLTDSARDAFSANFNERIDYLATLLPGDCPRQRATATAMALFAGLLGTLQLARAASDPALSDQLLAAGIDAALALAKL